MAHEAHVTGVVLNKENFNGRLFHHALGLGLGSEGMVSWYPVLARLSFWSFMANVQNTLRGLNELIQIRWLFEEEPNS